MFTGGYQLALVGVLIAGGRAAAVAASLPHVGLAA
jgi:hypothetical protein